MRCRGKLIQQFGVTEEKKEFLYPEEVCFLLKRDVIVLLSNDVPIEADVNIFARIYIGISSKHFD